jgi:hypothetical protein
LYPVWTEVATDPLDLHVIRLAGRPIQLVVGSADASVVAFDL